MATPVAGNGSASLGAYGPERLAHPERTDHDPPGRPTPYPDSLLRGDVEVHAK